MTTLPPMWIGPRGIMLLLVLAIGAGLFAQRMVWSSLVIGVVALALAAFAFDIATIIRAPLIERSFPESLMLARRSHVTYAVRNRARVGVRFAIFESPIARIAVDTAPALGALAVHGRCSVTIGLLPRERGQTHAGPAFVWYESMLGLVRRRMRVGAPEALRVRPDVSAIEGGDLAHRRRLIDMGLRRVRRRGTGSAFESLRDYVGGDPYRTIDWKATARRGKVMVSQYEVERSQQIMLALDAGRLMTPRLGDRRKLDYAVGAALGLAGLAGRSADRVGLYAFAAKTLAATALRSGNGHAAAINDLLSDLEPRWEDSDFEAAALELRRRCRKRSLIVVFTDVIDPIASGVVLRSLATLLPQHLVLVALMNDAAIREARALVPNTLADVYRAAVATKLAAERARAVTHLRGLGIGVVDVPAHEMTLAVLDAYLDVKTRALL